jgi:hypothetical protein
MRVRSLAIRTMLVQRFISWQALNREQLIGMHRQEIQVGTS